jgi:hypothetical protein
MYEMVVAAVHEVAPPGELPEGRRLLGPPFSPLPPTAHILSPTPSCPLSPLLSPGIAIDIGAGTVYTLERSLAAKAQALTTAPTTPPRPAAAAAATTLFGGGLAGPLEDAAKRVGGLRKQRRAAAKDLQTKGTTAIPSLSRLRMELFDAARKFTASGRGVRGPGDGERGAAAAPQPQPQPSSSRAPPRASYEDDDDDDDDLLYDGLPIPPARAALPADLPFRTAVVDARRTHGVGAPPAPPPQSLQPSVPAATAGPAQRGPMENAKGAALSGYNLSSARLLSAQERARKTRQEHQSASFEVERQIQLVPSKPAPAARAAIKAARVAEEKALLARMRAQAEVESCRMEALRARERLDLVLGMEANDKMTHASADFRKKVREEELRRQRAVMGLDAGGDGGPASADAGAGARVSEGDEGRRTTAGPANPALRPSRPSREERRHAEAAAQLGALSARYAAAADALEFGGGRGRDEDGDPLGGEEEGVDPSVLRSHTALCAAARTAGRRPQENEWAEAALRAATLERVVEMRAAEEYKAAATRQYIETARRRLEAGESAPDASRVGSLIPSFQARPPPVPAPARAPAPPPGRARAPRGPLGAVSDDLEHLAIGALPPAGITTRERQDRAALSETAGMSARASASAITNKWHRSDGLWAAFDPDRGRQPPRGGGRGEQSGGEWADAQDSRPGTPDSVRSALRHASRLEEEADEAWERDGGAGQHDEGGRGDSPFTSAPDPGHGSGGEDSDAAWDERRQAGAGEHWWHQRSTGSTAAAAAAPPALHARPPLQPPAPSASASARANLDSLIASTRGAGTAGFTGVGAAALSSTRSGNAGATTTRRAHAAPKPLAPALPHVPAPVVARTKSVLLHPGEAVPAPGEIGGGRKKKVFAADAGKGGGRRPAAAGHGGGDGITALLGSRPTRHAGTMRAGSADHTFPRFGVIGTTPGAPMPRPRGARVNMAPNGVPEKLGPKAKKFDWPWPGEESKPQRKQGSPEEEAYWRSMSQPKRIEKPEWARDPHEAGKQFW